MTDADHGSALVQMNVCLAFKSDCQSRTGLFTTSDGWRTWTAPWPGGPTPSGSPAASPSTTVSAAPSTPTTPPTFGPVTFLDPTHGLLGGGLPAEAGGAVTTGVLERTSDGGRTWTRTAFDGSPVIALASDGPKTAWAATGCVEGTCPSGILVSHDGGASWTPVSDRLVVGLTFVDDVHGWAVSPPDPSSHGDVFATSDGGRTWTPLRPPCDVGAAAAVSFASPMRGWVACGGEPGAGQQSKSILETDDAGQTWTVRSEANGRAVGTLTSSDYVAGLAMRPSGTGLLWMTRGTTLRTTDAGRTWTAIPPGVFDVTLPHGGFALDDQRWWLIVWNGDVGRQALEASTDGGTTWDVLATLDD
jgi:photosystem II stability/assembly factor-like uncharacterized protein